MFDTYAKKTNNSVCWLPITSLNKKHVIEIAQKFLGTEKGTQRNMDPDLLDLPILL